MNTKVLAIRFIESRNYFQSNSMSSNNGHWSGLLKESNQWQLSF